MFSRLHYYDDFYLDNSFWEHVSGNCRMRRRGLTKAIGEMDGYGYWRFDDSRDLFMWNYEWCRSHGIVKSFRIDFGYKACVLENVYNHWDGRVYFCEDDARCMAVEQGNPFDSLARCAMCFVDSSRGDYARFFFDEIDGECDGYAIEVAELFGFEMDKDEFGSRVAYSFKCMK